MNENKTNALKAIIKSHLHPETLSERGREIKSTNERIRNNSLKIVSKARHDRRHNGVKGTSKSKALKTFASYSKDS